MRDNTKAGLGGVGVVVFGVIGIFALALLITFLAGGFSALTANFRGKTDVREKTVANGDYRIAQYDKFYDECAAIVANEVRQRTARSDLKQATTPKEKQDARINLNALLGNHADLATTYNSDSSKAGTQAQFKASDLPFQIDPTATGGTTCAR